MKIHIREMIMFQGDPKLEYGIAKAYLNHKDGKGTRSEGKPIMVRWINEEKKFLVVDGYHRIVKGLLEGQRSFNCVYDWFKKKSFWVPPKEHRFTLEEVREISNENN